MLTLQLLPVFLLLTSTLQGHSYLMFNATHLSEWLRPDLLVHKGQLHVLDLQKNVKLKDMFYNILQNVQMMAMKKFVRYSAL